MFASVSNHFSPMKWWSERSTSFLFYFLSFNLPTVCVRACNSIHKLHEQIFHVEFGHCMCNSLSMLHLFHYFSIYFFRFFPCVSSQPSFLSLLLRAIYSPVHVCIRTFILKCYASSILRRQPLVIIITTAVLLLLLLMLLLLLWL